MGLNFLKKHDFDQEKKIEATKWPQFEFKKTPFRALKRAIKVDLLLIFVVFIPIAFQKLKESVLRGSVLQISLPVLTLLIRHKLCLSLCSSAVAEIPKPPS
jgi:hypothetical protein